ncbi:hypothetical protein E4T42_01443 [Aureobasidium subglaciale]|nr:hypothetical protein E4T42_01443 [Aureobasidium subglaciale]
MAQVPPCSLNLTSEVINRGSTAVIKRYRSNVVIKCPNQRVEHGKINYIDVEKRILDLLGPHPGIINFDEPQLTQWWCFLGSFQDPVGLLFTEANCADLQRYLDTHNQLISGE